MLNLMTRMIRLETRDVIRMYINLDDVMIDVKYLYVENFNCKALMLD